MYEERSFTLEIFQYMTIIKLKATEKMIYAFISSQIVYFSALFTGLLKKINYRDLSSSKNYAD